MPEQIKSYRYRKSFGSVYSIQKWSENGHGIAGNGEWLHLYYAASLQEAQLTVKLLKKQLKEGSK